MAQQNKKILHRDWQDGMLQWIGSVPSVIAHTVFFAASFVVTWTGVITFDKMLLVLTTVVSIEAIYLALFIQMTVNRHTQSLSVVEEEIEELEQDIDKIQEEEREEEVRDHGTRAVLDTIQAALKQLQDKL